MSVTRLLIVTPSLGRSVFYKEALSASDGKPWVEHIVVCPADRIHDLQRRAPHARVVAESATSSGMYGAINQGIRAATYKWDNLCYINDDDRLEPAFWTLPFSCIARGSRIIYGKTAVIDRNGQSRFVGSHIPLSCGVGHLLTQGILPFMQVSTLIPRNVVEKCGLFDASYRYCGDFEYFCRAYSLGVKFAFVNKVIGAFRVHGMQLSANHERMRAERDVALNTLLASKISSDKLKLLWLAFFRTWNAYHIAKRIAWFRRIRAEDMFR